MPLTQSNSKIGLTLGTRPEIIKCASLINELAFRGEDYVVIHTNQHYDWDLDMQFFEELGLPLPDHNLGIGSGAHGEQTARMMAEIEKVIEAEGITHMVVQGDTNSGLAGALVAAKALKRVIHVEAGLRSNDLRMPEEINRRIIDHISHDLFPPTETARKVLEDESVTGRIHLVTGNTSVDSVLEYSDKSRLPVSERENQILVTLHRPENVDDPRILKGILRAIDQVARSHDLRVVLPLHPRTRAQLEKHALKLPTTISEAPLLSFRELLYMQATSRLIMTDSGGIQEEACVLGSPCVVIRTHTDRPETVEVGAAELAGVDEEEIVASAGRMLSLERFDWDQPYGDGQAGRKIAEALLG
jgi:UDP-N-acetylglucosamine 2-epimerase (non-hydrolysing)